MAKKKAPTAPAVSDETEITPEQTGDGTAQAKEEPFVERLVSAFDESPVSEPDEEPQKTEESEDTETAVVSSVFHHTTVLTDEAAVAVPAEETDQQNAPVESAAEVAAAVPEMTEEERAAIRRDNADLAMVDESWNNPYRNVFVDSLERVTADDLGAPPKKKKKDPVDVIIDIFRRAIFWAAVVAFFVSGFQIVSKLYSYRESEKIYDFDNIFETMERREDLVATATRSDRLAALTPVNGTREESAELNNSAESNQFNEKLLILQGQLQILRNTNREIIGWIEMPGDTEINYPVVQGKDNDYYLHYAYNGAYNPAGSIYLDYRNTLTMSSNRHTVIYGHNMESGSPMFANLLHFKDESYWKNNRYINIYTDDALYTYEVFAAYETSPQQQGVENHSWRMNFNKDEKLFMKWVESVRARSDINPKVTVEADDRVITLSTCMNINENRYVVHGVLVEVVK